MEHFHKYGANILTLMMSLIKVDDVDSSFINNTRRFLFILHNSHAFQIGIIIIFKEINNDIFKYHLKFSQILCFATIQKCMSQLFVIFFFLKDALDRIVLLEGGGEILQKN